VRKHEGEAWIGRKFTRQAGADAFVLKRAIVTDLLPAVEAVRHARRSACWT